MLFIPKIYFYFYRKKMRSIPLKTGYLTVIFKKTQDAYDLKESSTKCFEKFKSFVVKKE